MALEHFIKCIESTGGVQKVTNYKGEEETVPVADTDWVDLADAYLFACDVMAREPKVEGE